MEPPRERLHIGAPRSSGTLPLPPGRTRSVMFQTAMLRPVRPVGYRSPVLSGSCRQQVSCMSRPALRFALVDSTELAAAK